MLKYLSINNLAEISCFVISLFSLHKEKNFNWKAFQLFILMTCIIEITGITIRVQNISASNQWLYNIYLVFEMAFNSAMFSLFINKYIKSKPYILLGLTIFFITYIFEIIHHGIFIFNNTSSTTSSIIFVLFSLFYFYLLINDPLYHSLKSYAPFWWVAGVLFYYFGSTICNLFFEELLLIKVIGHHLRYYIFNLLNIILYSCWSYSFICRYYQTD